MKCREARDIMNCLFDGDQHKREQEARDHMNTCPACREWYNETTSAFSMVGINESELPVIDFAPMVMSRLPDFHPVYAHRRRSTPRKVFAFTTASWVAGLLVMYLLSIFLQNWFAGIDINESAAYGYSTIKASAESVSNAAKIPVVLFRVAEHVINSLGIINIILTVIFAVSMLDAAILGTAFAIWRRKKAPGIMAI